MKKFTQIVEGETIEEFKQAVSELHSMVCLPLPSNAVGAPAELLRRHEAPGSYDIAQSKDGIASDSGTNAGLRDSTAIPASAKKAKKTKPVEVEPADDDEEVEEKSVISPSKLKKEAAAKEVEADEEGDDEDFLGAKAEEAEEEEVLDFDKIRELTQEIVDQYDMDKARSLCQKFGARTVSALKQADYVKFAAEAKKLLK